MPYRDAMGKHDFTTAGLDEETAADLRKLAAHRGCTPEHLVATAVVRFVNDEIGAITPNEFAHLPPYVETEPTACALDEAEGKVRVAMRAFLKLGEDAIERGDVYSQEEMERWFAERVATRSRAAAAE